MQHSTAQHSTAQHSTAPGTAQHSTAQHSTAQHSTAQHSTAQHSTAQHSTAQHMHREHVRTRREHGWAPRGRQHSTGHRSRLHTRAATVASCSSRKVCAACDRAVVTRENGCLLSCCPPASSGIDDCECANQGYASSATQQAMQAGRSSTADHGVCSSPLVVADRVGCPGQGRTLPAGRSRAQPHRLAGLGLQKT